MVRTLLVNYRAGTPLLLSSDGPAWLSKSSLPHTPLRWSWATGSEPSPDQEVRCYDNATIHQLEHLAKILNLVARLSQRFDVDY